MLHLKILLNHQRTKVKKVSVNYYQVFSFVFCTLELRTSLEIDLSVIYKLKCISNFKVILPLYFYEESISAYIYSKHL